MSNRSNSKESLLGQVLRITARALRAAISVIKGRPLQVGIDVRRSTAEQNGQSVEAQAEYCLTFLKEHCATRIRVI